jgi:hypothetical protein
LAREHLAALRAAAPTVGLLLLLLRLCAEGWHGLLARARLEVPLRLGRPRERGHEASGSLGLLLRRGLTVSALGLESTLLRRLLRGLLAVASVGSLRLLRRGLTANRESGRATNPGLLLLLLLLLHGAADGERGRTSAGVERLNRVVSARPAPHLDGPAAPSQSKQRLSRNG